MKFFTTLIFTILILSLTLTTGEAAKPEDLLAAQKVYQQGLDEFTRYHLTLDREHLANAIRFFKDSISVEPNFSKGYYALVSSLEEFEAGSSQIVAESLRELVDELFDPFVTGSAAASELGAIEVLGVCLERIRILESATQYGRNNKTPLDKILHRPLNCPFGGKYKISEKNKEISIECSAHGTPMNHTYLKADFAPLATHFASTNFKNYTKALHLLEEARQEMNAEAARQKAEESERILTTIIKEEPDFIEAYPVVMTIGIRSRLTESEQTARLNKFHALLKDPMKKRLARLAAGEMLEMELNTHCYHTRLMIDSGVKMFLLNKNAAKKAIPDLQLLLSKGYLKQMPVCSQGGEYSVRVSNNKPKVKCSVHGE